MVQTPVRPRAVACLPAWNAASFIEPTLQSLQAQTYSNLQVLISDDASSDETWGVIESFIAGKPRFFARRQPVNLGWIGNVNWLLQHADADYLFFAFHDDPLEPTYVERLVDALEASPDAVLAYTDVIVDFRGENERWVKTWSYPDLDLVASDRERLRVLTPMQGHWWIPNRGLFRKSAAVRIGGMRKHLAGEFCADWPWLVHLSLLGAFVRVPEPLVRKVWSREGLSKSWRWSAWRRVAVRIACACEIARADLPVRKRARLLGDFSAYWLRRWSRVPRRLWGAGSR